MEVTQESIKKNKKNYDNNTQKLLQERVKLMEQVQALRKRIENANDDIEIAELEFEESKLVQQISDITYTFKTNNLTLEQLDIQEEALLGKRGSQSYSDRVVDIKKEKQNLSKEQELTYCENEVEKCEKALKLYNLMGDSKKIKEWQESLDKATEELEFAKQEVNKDKALKETDGKQEPYINEYGEIIRPDNDEKAVATDKGYLAGYTMTEQDGVFIEETNQSLNNSLGQQMGERTIAETEDIKNGTRSVETKGNMENEDSRYTMYEKSEGVGGELIKLQKKMTRDNKSTGQKEELSYQKDSRGEMYSRKADGQMTFKITKTDKGVSIDEYRNGQPYATYEYDENGKALIGMGEIEEIDDDFVENFFDSQVPYFEAEGLGKNEQSKKVKSPDILKSAVEGTEEVTTTSTINEQAQTMKTAQREKQNTRQSYQEEYRENPETKTRANNNPESYRETLRFNVSSEMEQEIIDKNQESERDFTEDRRGKVEKHKAEDTEYGLR